MSHPNPQIRCPQVRRPPSAAHRHRGGLATQVATIWPSSGLFERVGGRSGVSTIIDRHYDRIEADPELFPIFRDQVGRNRRRQKMFFEEWMGGEPLYSQHVATQGTRLFHYIFPITRRAAGRWLRHFTEAMRDAALPSSVVKEALQVLGPMARALVRSAERGLPREIRRAGAELPSVLRECLARQPELLQRHPSDFERLLFLEAEAGRLDGVRTLLDLGIDVNVPTWQGGVFVAPWCIATRRGHRKVAQLLRRRGAERDIFSAAFLGDRQLVESLLAEDPSRLDAADPASDHRAVTPLAHAIGGGQFELAHWMLDRGAVLGPQAVHWVRHLSEVGERRLLLAILQRRHDLSSLGPGRWVLDSELAERLIDLGADVNRPAGGWLRYCTHQVGQREDAALVAALLAQGADPAARLDDCTALHKAVRAGYAETVEVLLHHGCEVEAEDASGNTPLGYLIFAHRRADRPALARRLLAAGADPHHRDVDGRTPLSRALTGRSAAAAELAEVLRSAGNDNL